MRSFLDDPSVERFAARRATGWRQVGSVVLLDLEGVREPDATGISAILAGARLDDAIERAELAVSILESGIVRLRLGATASPDDPSLLDESELTPAPVSVITTDGTLRLA